MSLPLKAESWIWYGIAVFLLVCRGLSRTILFGDLKHLQVDDWLMFITVAPYTVLIVVINIVALHSSNLLEPGTDLEHMSQSERSERIYGSKLILVVEQMQILTVWLIKACLLILYHRLTTNLPANRYVKALAIYVGVTFVVMEVLYLGVWCRPFSNYWALPTPSTQCSAATNHLIVNAVFNLSSDILMLGIGCSLFIRSKLPWSRKIILCFIFGIGVFVIVAAVLNKYYSFSHPFGSAWTYWYVRESSTALAVANLPFTWTLLRRMFKLDAFSAEHYGESSVPYHSSRSARGRHANNNSNRNSSSFNGWTGSVMKQNGGSQCSSIELKRIPLSHITTNPTAQPTSPARVHQPSHTPSWRDQGVFGKGDQELMADIEPWDHGDDRDAPFYTSPSASRRASVPVVKSGRQSRQSLSSGASSPRRDGASSPSRRLRDEEAQYKIQENVGSKFQFYDGPPESEEEEVESNAGMEDDHDEARLNTSGGAARPNGMRHSTGVEAIDFESRNLNFETSAVDEKGALNHSSSNPFHNHTEAPSTQSTSPSSPVASHSRLPSRSSERRRRSIVNRVAPALWSGA